MSNREQFEAWYLENWGHTEDNHESLFERCQDGCGDEYYRLGVRMAHEAWQAASKASEQQLAAVVAENAGLKQTESNLVRNIINDLGDTEFQYSRASTPATDAYLAEVRAQGVEMFADMTDKVADEEEFYDNGESFDSLKYTAKQARLFAAQLRQGAAL